MPSIPTIVTWIIIPTMILIILIVLWNKVKVSLGFGTPKEYIKYEELTEEEKKLEKKQ